MRTFLKRILITLLLFSLLVYFGVYFSTPAYFVKPEIQDFLNKEYNKKFKVVQVDKNYSPDLFHQPTGYSLILEDSSGIRFDNIYVQNNEAQGKWITYMGTDIEEEYKTAKDKNQKRIKK